MSGSSESVSSDAEDLSRLKEIMELINDTTLQQEDPGAIAQFEKDLNTLDEDSFFYFFGVYRAQYQSLFVMLEEPIRTSHRSIQDLKDIRPRDMLLLCLKFLATGSSFRDMGLQLDMTPSTVATIVIEVSTAINQILQPTAMPTPTAAMWRAIAKEFHEKYDLPNCMGAVYAMRLNIMNMSSMDIIVIVDTNNKIIMLDVGRYGIHRNLAAAFNRSMIADRFVANELDVPEDEAPVDGAPALPYMIVAAACFPAKSYLLAKYKNNLAHEKPANKIFNFRINRAVQIAKDTMTRLRRRFRIIRGPIPVAPAMVEDIVATACCLYNHLNRPTIRLEEPALPVYNVTPEEIAIMRASLPEPVSTRLKYHHFFLTPEGCVPWQWSPLTPKQQ